MLEADYVPALGMSEVGGTFAVVQTLAGASRDTDEKHKSAELFVFPIPGPSSVIAPETSNELDLLTCRQATSRPTKNEFPMTSCQICTI